MRSRLYLTPLLPAAINGHVKVANLLRRHLTKTNLFPSQFEQVIEGSTCKQRGNSSVEKVGI